MRIFPQRNDEAPSLVMTDEDTRECAWCNEEQGKEQGNGSHGICSPHATKIRQAQAERKAARNIRH